MSRVAYDLQSDRRQLLLQCLIPIMTQLYD